MTGREKSPSNTVRHTERIQDEDDGDKALSQLGDCQDIYLALEACLIDNDRAWTTCQAHVKALRACQENRTSGPRSGGTAPPTDR